MALEKKDYVSALPVGSASLYDAVLRWTFPEQRIREAVIDALVPHWGDLILDVGCGTGSLLAMIAAKEADATLVGIDPSANMLEVAKGKLHEVWRSTLLEMKAARLDFSNGTFDKAVSTLVFHHLQEEEKAVALCEIHRVLKPGGLLVLADFARPATPIMRLLFCLIQSLDGFDNTRAHVQGRLPSLISGAGFTMLRENGIHNTLFGTVRIYSAFRP